MERVKIEKDSVQETLMLPLYGKAYAMQTWPELFHDNDVLGIKEKVDYDFSEMVTKTSGLKGKIGALSAAYRQLALATEAKAYLANHPKAVVVSLGCGLDTTARQADNGTCRFVNLDFANVIETREALMPSTERDRNIAGDILDFSWFDEIDFNMDEGAFFLVSGVFMYFKRKDVRDLLTTMAEQFPGAAICFDGQNAKGSAMDLKALKDSGVDISLNFYLDDPVAEMMPWSDRFEKIDSKGMIYPYLDPQPFGFIFKAMSRYSDKTNLATINTVFFKK